MGRKEKLRLRLNSIPKDFTWDELVSLLKQNGFEVINGSGSRYKFFHREQNKLLSYHKPHPSNIVKEYVLKEVISTLDEII
ncbi:type II toxin-antitoxin system HicA family toxin [Providencia rettgeri]|uniref:type II toxin-antitoxin system HicA family toxin n=1 Tax=unclassified Providencia TaxID=2633465 RepID=UPI00234A2549|nr:MULTISPECIES: type II toxin-antitoxin system HicA family toxin [unclassified Providencia]